MNEDKPFIEQMKDSVPSVDQVKDSFENTTQDISESIGNIKENVQSSINEFSNKSFVDASSEFLDSNSLLAKFAFIVIVLIVFMFLLKIFMTLLGHFMSPSSNPYIVKGSLNGNEKIVITQDPSKDSTVSVLKSNDKHRGLEFTWSIWLFLNENDNTSYQNVFVKGVERFKDGEVNLVNGPGLYIKKDVNANANEINAHIFMDHIGGKEVVKGDYDEGRDEIKVESIPIKKWVHLAIRMQNTVLDVYVNGTIAKRHNMDRVPKQNFYDIIACANGGFQGKISNLRYYSHALNVFELNNIVMFGPNTTPSDVSIDSQASTGNYSYLSNIWYSNKY